VEEERAALIGESVVVGVSDDGEMLGVKDKKSMVVWKACIVLRHSSKICFRSDDGDLVLRNNSLKGEA